MARQPNIIILMGVSGCGKTTVGEQLAERLGVSFFDGDDFHSAEARKQMDGGERLTEVQRVPWRQRLEHLLDDLMAKNTGGVLACSCLSRAFRAALIGERANVLLFYLKAEFETILDRIEQRTDHYFKSNLLTSQFETLEEPTETEGVVLDAERAVETLVEQIIESISSD